MVWKRSDVDRSKAYQAALCQAASGLRYFSLHELGAAELPADCCLLTETVPMDLLLRGDLIGISESVQLTTGERFDVDAHGVWLTRQEVEAMATVSLSKVPWHNGIAPRFAPR